MRFLSAALLLLLTVAPLAGQGEHPAFRRFGLAEGLPQSQVSVLYEDSHGFIWVGTLSGGLARLGASGFRVFAAAEGLQVRSVGALLEDRNGHIWVCGRDGGLSEISGERVINHGAHDGIPETRVHSLALDADGRVLAGSSHGLYRLEGHRFAHVPLPGAWADLPLFRLACDAQGTVWGLSRNGRLIRWDGRHLEEEALPGHASREVRDLKADRNGRVWALTESALFRRDPSGWNAEPLRGLPPKPKMNSLSFSPAGEPLIALGQDGVWYREGARTRRLTAKDGLPRNLITAVLRDGRGGLWVGSDGDGLAAHLVPGLWSYATADAPAGVDMGAVMTFTDLGGGRLLIPTDHGLALFQEGKGIVRHWGRPQGLRSDSLWCALPAKPHGVWIGTEEGLQLWREGRLRPGPAALEDAAITALVRHEGKIWAATDKGLAALDESGAFLGLITVSPELGPASVAQLISHQGRLVAGSAAGLMVLQDGRLVPLAPPEIYRLTAGGLMKDEKDQLWIASTSGLVKAGEPLPTRLGTAQGLLDENFTWAVDLGNGRQAGGHGRGVSFITPGGIHHLTKNLGLLSDETNQNGVMLDAKGRLWIGMIGGFNRLDDPAGFANASIPPPVVLEVRWPGGSASFPQRLELPPLPQAVELRFDLGQPGLPAVPRYQAFLEGVDSEWRDVNPGNALQYLRLGKGPRYFRLRASVDGVRWVEAQPLPLVVRPAWHERWTVRILLLALLGGAGALAARWRLRRLALAALQLEAIVEDRTYMLDRQYGALARAHEQIKRSLEFRIRLADMVSHELRSPITSITLAVDRLRDEDDGPARDAMLSILERESRRIDDLVRALLDRSRSEASLRNLNIQPTTPQEVVEGFQEVLRLKAGGKELHFHLDLPGDQSRVKVLVDATALRQAILNLFENAVKFTPPGGNVGLRSRIDSATMEWVLTVWDNGRGIPKHRQEAILQPFVQAHAGDAGDGWGLGLSIVQALVEAHGGTLALESEEGRGASFSIMLPVLER